jgi:hypothetical protein
MPGENIADWSTTAASNATADSSINWAEGQARSTVNDSARSMMAAIAKKRNLENFSITTGGSANAHTFTSGVSYTSTPTGLRANLRLGSTNTGSATLNMDGIGAVTIKDILGNNLVGGELVSGRYAEFFYNGTNWIFLGGGSNTISHTAETTTSGSEVNITSLPSGTKRAEIRIFKLQAASSGADLRVRLSTDNGSNYLAGAADYGWVYHSAQGELSDDSSSSYIFACGDVRSDIDDCMGVIDVYFKTASRAFVQSRMVLGPVSGGIEEYYGAGYTENTCNAVRLIMSTSTITTITYSVTAYF